MRPLCLLKQNLRGNKNKFQLGINTISSLAPVLQKKFRSNVFMTLFRKTKRYTIIGKTIISYPLIRTGTCTYQGVRILFSENLASFVFLKHPFWDSPFCLITDNLFYHFLMLPRNHSSLNAKVIIQKAANWFAQQTLDCRPNKH